LSRKTGLPKTRPLSNRLLSPSLNPRSNQTLRAMRPSRPLLKRRRWDLSKKKDRYIVGLDVGTHKICAIVAEVTDEGRLDVIGIGQAESKGLRKGVVINLEATVDSIKRVVEEAELMAGVEIGSAYVVIAGHRMHR